MEGRIGTFDDPLVPEDEGIVSKGEAADSFGRVPKYEFRTGRAATLGEMTGEFAFFTPAVLYLAGGFTDAPLADFCRDNPGVRFFHKKFDRPIFSGLSTPDGDRDWDSVLWAVRAAFARPLVDFLVSLTLLDDQARSVWGVGLQTLSVVDPLAADNALLYSRLLPPLTVKAFGVNGSRFRAGFVPAPRPTLPPVLRRFGPDPKMQQFAAKLYAGENPMAADPLKDES